MKSSGVTRVTPGTICTRSQPRSRKIGHNMSASCAASPRLPSETDGAAFFAPSATAKWPRNNPSPSQSGAYGCASKWSESGPKMESPPGQVGFSRGENSFQACARMALKLFVLSAKSIGAASGKSRGETVENIEVQVLIHQSLRQVILGFV